MTRPPVTTSGWYETERGLTYYYWDSGQLCEGRTVSGWAEMPDREALGEEYQEWCRHSD